MTVKELKSHVSEWGFIELVSSKSECRLKKGWIKRYDLNDSFDSFDSFDILIYTDKHKLRGNECVPKIATAYNDNEKAKLILIECIEKDLNEGFDFVK